MARLFGTVIALMALSPISAYAQSGPQPTSPQFQTVLSAPQHVDAVLAAAKQSTVWIRHQCRDASFKPMASVRVWKAAEFDSTGGLTAGVWGETLIGTGCGMSRKLNVMTLVRSPRVLVSQVLAPGDTSADPILQKDASKYVAAAFRTKAMECKDAFVDDTKAVREEPSDDIRVKGPILVENWIISACGQNIDVEVKFMPMVAGETTIVAHAQ